MREEILSGIRTQRLSILRNNVDFMSKETAFDLLVATVKSSLTQYDMVTFVAELLYWCTDEEIHTETSRSKYAMVLQEVLVETENNISEGYKTKLRAVGQKVRRLKDLLKVESNPNKKDTTGNSALHYASELGLNKLVEGFLILGGNINLQNRQEDTPCHVAARLGRKYLLKDILLDSSMKEKVDWEKQGEKLDRLIEAEWGNQSWITVMFHGLEKPLQDGFRWCLGTYFPVAEEEAVQVEHDGRLVWVEKSETCKCKICGKTKYSTEHDVFICDDCRNDTSKMVKDEITGFKIPIMHARVTGDGIITHISTIIENKVRPYHSKPRINFFKAPSESNPKRFFGFELELVLETRRKMELASTLIDTRAGNEFYMNTDGSIRPHVENDENFDSGFELISQPMTLQFIKESAKVEDTFNILERTRARSLNNQSTGFHVHISRDGFKDAQNIRAFHKFFYSRANADFIADIAGRERTHYQGNTQTTPPRGFSGGIRYEMINYQNSATIEVRLFKGGVGKYWMLEKIEFLDCLIEFSQTDKSRTVDEFEKYALKQGSYEGTGRKKKFIYKYPELVSFLENRKAKQKPIPFLFVA